jgi:hypothetical protein
MKPFKVNRDSWHYKLNKHFLNDRGDNEYYMQDYWERKHNNFCAYWRVTMLRLVVAMFGSAIILMLLFGLGQSIYQHPWDTFVVVGSVVGVVLAFGTIIVCGMFLSEYFEKRKYQNEDIPDSLFVAKYKSYKSKVCPMVEYDK